MAKGSARSTDHNLQVHAVWHFALKHKMALWIERVGTHDSIADCPTRDETWVLDELGATWVEPVLPTQIWEPQRWADMELTW